MEREGAKGYLNWFHCLHFILKTSESIVFQFIFVFDAPNTIIIIAHYKTTAGQRHFPTCSTTPQSLCSLPCTDKTLRSNQTLLFAIRFKKDKSSPQCSWPSRAAKHGRANTVVILGPERPLPGALANWIIIIFTGFSLQALRKHTVAPHSWVTHSPNKALTPAGGTIETSRKKIHKAIFTSCFHDENINKRWDKFDLLLIMKSISPDTLRATV